LALTRNPETLERELIFGMMQHYRFYVEMRGQVCPRDLDTGLIRRDFKTDRYNTLYDALDTHWRRYDNAPGWEGVDMPAPVPKVEAYIVDWINNKVVPGEKNLPLIKELKGERAFAAEMTLEGCRVLANSPEFATWRDGRLADDLIATINKQARAGKLGIADIQAYLVILTGSIKHFALFVPIFCGYRRVVLRWFLV
jgi:hypothetical protein